MGLRTNMIVMVKGGFSLTLSTVQEYGNGRGNRWGRGTLPYLHFGTWLVGWVRSSVNAAIPSDYSPSLSHHRDRATDNICEIW